MAIGYLKIRIGMAVLKTSVSLKDPVDLNEIHERMKEIGNFLQRPEGETINDFLSNVEGISPIAQNHKKTERKSKKK